MLLVNCYFYADSTQCTLIAAFDFPVTLRKQESQASIDNPIVDTRITQDRFQSPGMDWNLNVALIVADCIVYCIIFLGIKDRFISPEGYCCLLPVLALFRTQYFYADVNSQRLCAIEYVFDTTLDLAFGFILPILQQEITIFLVMLDKKKLTHLHLHIRDDLQAQHPVAVQWFTSLQHHQTRQCSSWDIVCKFQKSPELT